MKIKSPFNIILLCLLHITVCNAVDSTSFINQSSKVEDGELVRVYADDGRGFYIELVQRPSEQTSAFYIGRGFDAESIKQYSNTCIFHVTLSNKSDNVIYNIDLSNWYAVNSGNRSVRLNLIDMWEKKWNALDVSKEAQIAFRFSQLPQIQQPGTGDWFQGMISLNLNQDELFDLNVIWGEGELTKNSVIKDLKCASK